MYEVDGFLEETYRDSRPRFRFGAETDWATWRKDLSHRLADRMGINPEDWSARAPAAEPRLLERTSCDGYVRERVEWTTFDGMVMPVYVLIPEKPAAGRHAVVALHGHGYGSREIVGLEPDGTERSGDPGLHKDFAVALARQGFVVAAPELLGFGDRRLAEDKLGDPARSSCFRLAAHLMMLGRSLAGIRIAETMQTIGYLLSRPETYGGRMGCMGISGGGLVAAFTAAMDERIGATVVSGYANTFEDSILDRAHCLDNYVPGLLLEAELPELIGLIAPRALLMESGDQDLVFPRGGAERAYEKLGQIYAASGVADKLEADFFDGGHEIGGERAYDWLKSTLTEEGAAESEALYEEHEEASRF
jgi:dienelactone hydrolase